MSQIFSKVLIIAINSVDTLTEFLRPRQFVKAVLKGIDKVICFVRACARIESQRSQGLRPFGSPLVEFLLGLFFFIFSHSQGLLEIV